MEKLDVDIGEDYIRYYSKGVNLMDSFGLLWVRDTQIPVARSLW